MKQTLNIFTYICIFTVLIYLTHSKTLKAMLYCYLPAIGQDPRSEYSVLVAKINSILSQKHINVEVGICDSNGNGGNLYDTTKINDFFNQYDIVQVDVMYISAITVPLMKFKKSDISYYSDVFAFEWDPVTRNVDGQNYLVGSPGLLCSDFQETRMGNYKDRLYANYKSKYGLVSLYTNIYLNQQADRTLDNMVFDSVDVQSIGQVAKVLKNCQQDDSKFQYDSCWCVDELKWDFTQTNYKKTIGYSQNLFNIMTKGNITSENIDIKHIMDEKEKRLVYVDQFIAKDTSDPQERNTILKFYQAMLSKEILDIYVKGLYTKRPGQITYLLPPIKSYFASIRRYNKIYDKIYKSLFKAGSSFHPIYQQAYYKNISNLSKLIKQGLKYWHQVNHHHLIVK